VKKIDELTDPESCLSKAKDDELIFVLLARDPCAASAVEHWIRERVRRGINKLSDAKIVSAIQWCQQVNIRS
jgi:hypothetical protein